MEQEQMASEAQKSRRELLLEYKKAKLAGGKTGETKRNPLQLMQGAASSRSHLTAITVATSNQQHTVHKQKSRPASASSSAIRGGAALPSTLNNSKTGRTAAAAEENPFITSSGVPSGRPSSTHLESSPSMMLGGGLERKNTSSSFLSRPYHHNQKENTLGGSEEVDSKTLEVVAENSRLRLEMDGGQAQIRELRRVNERLVSELEELKNELIREVGIDAKMHNDKAISTFGSPGQFNNSKGNSSLIAQKDLIIMELTLLIEKLRQDHQQTSYGEDESRIKQLEELLCQKESELAESKLEIDGLSKSLELKQSDNEQLSQSLGEAREMMESISQSLKDLKSESEAELQDSLNCLETVEEERSLAVRKVEHLESEIVRVEAQYSSLCILRDAAEIEKQQLSTALVACLKENQEIHEKLALQKDQNGELSNDLEALHEATAILEAGSISQQKELDERLQEIENLRIDLYRVEEEKTIALLMQSEAEILLAALRDSLYENKELHQRLKQENLTSTSKDLHEKQENTVHPNPEVAKESLIESQNEVSFLKAELAKQQEKIVMLGFKSLGFEKEEEEQEEMEKAMNTTEIACQTDINMRFVMEQFNNAIKALRIAEMSNNVMHQKNISLTDGFEAGRMKLMKENSELQKMVQKTSELEGRLIKGLDLASKKCARLEKELEEERKSKSND